MQSLLASSAGSGAVELPPVSTWVWVGFLSYVAALLFLDLFVLNRKHEEPTLKHTLLQVGFFVANGLGVGAFIWFFTDLGSNGAAQYFAAYVMEWSLSVDNIFVIALAMTFFAVPRQYHHKVLFYGIAGAIVMRFLFITVGYIAIQLFSPVMVLFGLFLIWTAWKLATGDDEDPEIENMRVYKIATKLFNVTDRFHGDKFFTRIKGKRTATRLLLVVIVVEGIDVVFAVDSVPAVLAITNNYFIAFSSNIMAIMGLRAVYFLYAYIESKISRLNEGLALILGFIGLKMIAANDATWQFFGLEGGFHVPTFVSLGVILLILAGSVVASIVWPKKEDEEVCIAEVIESDDIMVEPYIDCSQTMDGEWEKGLVERYLNEVIEAVRNYDSDHHIPAYGFAEEIGSMDDATVGEHYVPQRLALGDGCNLANVLRHAEATARTTTGRYIFVIVTDGRVSKEQEEEVSKVFVTMPDNAFVLFVRVSDEAGGSDFLDYLNIYNVGGGHDRCDTIHATDDNGQPRDSIADLIGREIDVWLGRENEEVSLNKS